ncbi:MAG: tRNA (N(6)-L-threonylcarbamoyladenosine(37)-C(2))-methylthiotransferase MtaB [Proteobacteria bacterium]|nr:tRNA (N(6)-L-threonylcarbamoyladenosine(37)-C(2))-methylthiotransferase MtaB [Pseudomonadota bacterium]
MPGLVEHMHEFQEDSCKVNSFDSHAIENQFKALGWQLADSPVGAAVSVVNTCSVTQNADKEARYLARRFRKENPDGLVVMMGCYAQTDSARLDSMSEIDVIVPNEAKEQTVEFVLQQLETKRSGGVIQKFPDGVKVVSGNRQSHFKSSVTLFDRADSSQTRAFVKIQDGCNGFCTYCLIPYARGASRSVPEADALREIRRLVEGGTKEIVLTGIHIGDFGAENLSPEELLLGDPFVEFMKRVFDIDGLRRVRISSLEPAELTEPLVKVLAAHRDRFCDHFHLPLQAGSNDILKKMRRKYDKSRYKESCDMARAHFPNVCLGADVIPGFPTETEEQFLETVSFIRECGIHYLHVFPYSSRPNTAASKMPGHLDPVVVKQRAQVLRAMSLELRQEFYARFIGSTVNVLWEKSLDDQGRPMGLTSNYLNVTGSKTDSSNLPGLMSKISLRGFTSSDRLLGVGVSAELS